LKRLKKPSHYEDSGQKIYKKIRKTLIKFFGFFRTHLKNLV
jgi:hypothetical protein